MSSGVHEMCEAWMARYAQERLFLARVRGRDGRPKFVIDRRDPNQERFRRQHYHVVYALRIVG
jgi:hypothetical protein